jgi:hypothetical protein
VGRCGVVVDRCGSLSIEQREINLDNKFTRTGLSDDIACSSNFCLLSVVVFKLNRFLVCYLNYFLCYHIFCK